MKRRDTETPSMFPGLEYPSDPFRRGNRPAPLAAQADPSTSHEAAARLEATGKLNAQCEAVFELVKRWPGRTSAELEAAAKEHGIDIDRPTIARRLPDLAKAGKVYQGAACLCEAHGTKAVTWWVTGMKETVR